MVHVSRMADKYIEDPNEVVKEGDVVDVTLFEIDNQGRTNLTMVDNPKKDTGDRRPPRRDNNNSGNRRHNDRREDRSQHRGHRRDH